MEKKEKWTVEGKLSVVQLYESGKYSFAKLEIIRLYRVSI